MLKTNYLLKPSKHLIIKHLGHSCTSFFIVCTLLLCHLSSCINSNTAPREEESSTNDPLAQIATEDNTIERDAYFLKKSYPKLASVVPESNPLYEKLNAYSYDVSNPAKSIKTEDNLKRLFFQREKDIIPMLHAEVFERLTMKDPDFFVGNSGRQLQAELQKIGMQCIYAEGMYVDLAAAEMLAPQLTQLGSEILRMYIDFIVSRGNAVGGEYPYSNLDGEMAMLNIGGQMLDKYSDHAYTKAILSDLNFTLSAMTDLHKVNGHDGNTTTISGDLLTEPYPNMIDLEVIKHFADKYPQSKYAGLLSRIAANPSEMTYSPQAGSYQDLYLVAIEGQPTTQEEETISCDDAKVYQTTKYLDKGIDVPHVLQINKEDQDTCLLVHRFYPDRARAEKALQGIRTQIPPPNSISIIHIAYNEEADNWEIRN